eukprot:snap_masked-scaffold77_size404793-processed-gene-3.2 protein:Tk04795 transcript:snap_masked-scaffold77_size404793-processed-gene-3.2-mRNA-1 annotation:"decaprenyl-diphosphate synthase subunit 1"
MIVDEISGDSLRRGKCMVREGIFPPVAPEEECHLSFLPNAIKRLEKADLPLAEALAILDDAKLRIETIPGTKGQLLQQKITNVLRRNPGMEVLQEASKVLKGNGVILPEGMSPDDVSKMKFCPTTSEIMFSRLCPRVMLQAPMLEGVAARHASSTGVVNPLLQKPATIHHSTDQHLPRTTMEPIRPSVDANELVHGDLQAMFKEIHQELDFELKTNDALRQSSQSMGVPPHQLLGTLGEMAKYYFDGQGKAVRPVIAMTLGHAFNHHQGLSVSERETVANQQRKVAIISEMIHTASLVHDDILDHAETRRGKPAVNQKWDATRSALCGDYILAIGAKVLAQLRNEEVLIVLAQVLADLVHGEFQQLQNKEDESERFNLYLNKTFNKTASLIAYSCKANAILTHASPELIEGAFKYGKNIGIAFQLVDDLLDFESSSAALGKPAAADLKLGLATAPVLFASIEYPELETLIQRRFSKPMDVERAFEFVSKSKGLRQTKDLAKQHCDAAVEAIEGLAESPYKCALITLTDTMLSRKK